MTADVTRSEHKQTAGILTSPANVLRLVIISAFGLKTPGSNQLFGVLKRHALKRRIFIVPCALGHSRF